MRIELDVTGDKQLNRELLRFSDRILDAAPAFEAILLDLADHEREQFDSRGELASGGWRDLADSTKARKRASADPTIRANAEVILKATEALYKSLIARTEGGDAIRRAESDELLFGTSVPYARFHQLGQGVPRRRPVELREQDRVGTVRKLQRYLTTGTL